MKIEYTEKNYLADIQFIEDMDQLFNRYNETMKRVIARNIETGPDCKGKIGKVKITYRKASRKQTISPELVVKKSAEIDVLKNAVDVKITTKTIQVEEINIDEDMLEEILEELADSHPSLRDDVSKWAGARASSKVVVEYTADDINAAVSSAIKEIS